MLESAAFRLGPLLSYYVANCLSGIDLKIFDLYIRKSTKLTYK